MQTIKSYFSIGKVYLIDETVISKLRYENPIAEFIMACKKNIEMKKIIIVLLLVCIGYIAEAQSMLKVRLADNTPINVALDGRYFNKRGTSITVGDLPPGRHYLKIFIVSQARNGRGVEDIIYEGRVRTHEGMINVLTYDPNSQQVQMEEQEIDRYMSSQPAAPPPNEGNWNENQMQDNNQGGNMDNNDNANAAPASSAPTGTLDDAKVDNLKTKVTAKNTDTERMKALKEGLQGETFTVFQVGTMMDWFSFESSKVDFAEWAYPNTVDKEYFSDLESKLTYKNYRDDLDKFIKSR